MDANSTVRGPTRQPEAEACVFASLAVVQHYIHILIQILLVALVVILQYALTQP